MFLCQINNNYPLLSPNTSSYLELCDNKKIVLKVADILSTNFGIPKMHIMHVSVVKLLLSTFHLYHFYSSAGLINKKFYLESHEHTRKALN